MACFSYRIREVRETSTVLRTTPGGRVQLHLLIYHLRELELRLDDLNIVWEYENLIDRSYSKVVTRKVQATSRWRTTRKRSRHRLQ